MPGFINVVPSGVGAGGGLGVVKMLVGMNTDHGKIGSISGDVFTVTGTGQYYGFESFVTVTQATGNGWPTSNSITFGHSGVFPAGVPKPTNTSGVYSLAGTIKYL